MTHFCEHNVFIKPFFICFTFILFSAAISLKIFETILGVGQTKIISENFSDNKKAVSKKIGSILRTSPILDPGSRVTIFVESLMFKFLLKESFSFKQLVYFLRFHPSKLYQKYPHIRLLKFLSIFKNIFFILGQFTGITFLKNVFNFRKIMRITDGIYVKSYSR